MLHIAIGKMTLVSDEQKEIQLFFVTFSGSSKIPGEIRQWVLLGGIFGDSPQLLDFRLGSLFQVGHQLLSCLNFTDFA